MTITMESLHKAGSCLPLQALFYTDGCRSHLDLGSNDGRTLRGLDPATITAVELFGPSVAELRKAGLHDVAQMDVRYFVKVAARMPHSHWDRVTSFDVIEHLPRADGEELLDQIECIAAREIVIFMPIETPELCATEKWQQFREEGLSLHPDAQRELQDHLSQWSPADFQQRGYLTMFLPNFHYQGFGAFFAAKYRDPADQATVLARVQEFARRETPLSTGPLHWGHLGAGSGVVQPLFVNGAEQMFLGDGVGISYGARLECIREYGGQTYSPALVIGDKTTAEFFLHIGCAEKVVIGRDVMIAGHCSITDHQHGYDPDRPLHGQPLTVAPVEIQDSVFIGEYVHVLPGVTIGTHSVIGSHSVVTHDIPPYSVAVGIPARVIREVRGERGCIG